MKPKGLLSVLSPLVDWWTNRYGFADPAVDFSAVRPWKPTMERYLINVSYGESYFGVMFLCSGQKA